ncbi:hypothetical protein B9T34_01055 [Acinetobacter sp. ANC 3813]|nr:hypothetical protein B9T34_01055 [Acinetobacter sp. ANC 3813]
MNINVYRSVTKNAANLYSIYKRSKAQIKVYKQHFGRVEIDVKKDLFTQMVHFFNFRLNFKLGYLI